MNRRRCISILAGSGAAALTGCRRPGGAPATRWHGVLFNAEVDLAVQDLPREEAQGLIERCVAEMQRLERIFSLYVPDSVLCTLNQDGRIANAPAEFVALVEEALSIARKTGGVFDPTVQPYWVWLREAVESGRGVEAGERARRLALVDYRRVWVSGPEVRFEKPAMGMTLNGIAQGWITDRVCELLREAGAEHCLVNLGEFFAIGPQRSGADWQVGLRGAGDAEVVALRERALAVSSGAGLFFGTGEGMNHLIDPHSGRCAEDRRLVAVTAADACTADALSTACAVLGDEEARGLVRKWKDATLRILRPV